MIREFLTRCLPSRIQYWLGRRYAIRALCLSLENTPEKWKLGETSANQGNIYIREWRKHSHMVFQRYVEISIGASSYDLSWRQSKRVRKSLKRANANNVLRKMVLSLKTQQIGVN